MRTRKATGGVHDYGDPRLLHERGLVASLERGLARHPGRGGREWITQRAAELCRGDPRAAADDGREFESVRPGCE